MSKKKKQKKLWFSEHKREIIPPLVGVIIMFLVFGVINSQIISGKIASASGTISDPEIKEQTEQLSSTPANENPTIRIAKIGVEAPVLFDAENIDEQNFQELLKSGTVHYPTTAEPGNYGNTVIFGHSSGRWWAPGDYKFVFTKLDKLETGDKIFIDYSNKRYLYEVTNQRIILPTDLSVLSQETDHQLTLLTCYPVGSNAKRLVISAKQISPAPAEKQTTTKPSENQIEQALPSTTPSLWDNLRDIL